MEARKGMVSLVENRYDLLSWDALEEYLMGEIKNVSVIIWGNDNCPECENIKKYYSTAGYKYNNVDELVSGEKADVDAMVQLAFQQMRLPLIKVDNEWVDPEEIKSKIESEVA